MKATPTQERIFDRHPAGQTVRGYNDAVLFPLYGSGEHFTAYRLEAKGIGQVVSSSKNHSHSANMFFKFNDDWRFNYVTRQIENA